MSGHSKWATTKRKKFAIDAKKSANFTKLANAISVAARSGGDPSMNFGLRMAIDKAKSFSLPKENIERAIKRGTGELGGSAMEEVLYEGFGPGQIAILVECLSDNKNRTLNEIKLIFDKNGGALAGQGSVSWMFDKKAVIVLQNRNSQNLTEEMELQIIESGAEDFQINEEEIVVYTSTNLLQQTKENLEKFGFTVMNANLEYVAKEKNNLSEEDEEKLQKLLDALEEQNEMTEYYTNN